MDENMITSAALCAGFGGIELALASITDINLQWVSETDEHASLVLEERFGVPNLGDLTEIVDPPKVDLIAAGFPCQPLSLAGRQKGEQDERWLINDVVRIAEETEAKVLILENVLGIYTTNQGEAFRHVIDRLASGGWTAEWGRFRAAQVGAPHRRERWFCVAVRDADSLAWAASIPFRSIKQERDSRDGERGGQGYSETVSDASISRRVEGTGLSQDQQGGVGGHGSHHNSGTPTPDTNHAGRSEHGGPQSIREEQSAAEHLGDPVPDAISLSPKRRGVSGDVGEAQEDARRE